MIFCFLQYLEQQHKLIQLAILERKHFEEQNRQLRAMHVSIDQLQKLQQMHQKFYCTPVLLLNYHCLTCIVT